MSKAEIFIEEHTKKSTNEIGVIDATNSHHYHLWLTPDQAKEAVEIAREEIMEWIRNNIRNYAFMVTDEFEGDVDVDTAINDLKQAMKDK